MPVPDREARLVAPFYLKLMRFNATWVGHEVWDDAVAAGRSASVSDLEWLLERREWRPNVMGAWFSLGHPELSRNVLDCLDHSLGSLTSPPLTVAAAVLTGRLAEPILRTTSVRTDEESRRVLDAALLWLGLEPEDEVEEASATAFSDLANFGLKFRSALSAD